MREDVLFKCEEAITYLRNGNYGDAIILFNEVLKKDPKNALAWNNRGLALLALGHPFDAVMNLDKAIEFEPTEAGYYNNKGAALFDDEEGEASLEYFKKALELNPDFPEAHNNMGNAYTFLGHLRKAAKSYRDSVKARPDYADAHLHLSFTELALGNYIEGWKEFEWRWKTHQMPERGLELPHWEGEDLTNKTLLIYGEQGHGDSIQFIRYATEIKKKYPTVRIVAEVRLPLARLVETVDGVDLVVVLGTKLPEGIDFIVPMMSLPRIMGTTIDTVPWNGPYFTIDQHLKDHWTKQLKKLPKGLLIGICWAGMSRTGQVAAEAVDRKRSTTLSTFAPLAAIPGISWVSLQKGPPAEQVKQPPLGMNIGDWTDGFDDFYDTAAMVSNLDLVITVDTAVVHLAAALGKPTWLLSRWAGCWRWLDNQPTNPWYPTVRVFGQPGPRQWDPAVFDVAQALKKRVASKAAA